MNNKDNLILQLTVESCEVKEVNVQMAAEMSQVKRMNQKMAAEIEKFIEKEKLILKEKNRVEVNL